MADHEHVPSVIALSIALGWYTWRLQRQGMPRSKIALRIMGAASEVIVRGYKGMICPPGSMCLFGTCRECECEESDG